MGLCRGRLGADTRQNCSPQPSTSSSRQNSTPAALKYFSLKHYLNYLNQGGGTFGSFRDEVDSFGFAAEALPGAVYPDVGALDLVLGLRQGEVVLQHRLVRSSRAQHAATAAAQSANIYQCRGDQSPVL